MTTLRLTRRARNLRTSEVERPSRLRRVSTFRRFQGRRSSMAEHSFRKAEVLGSTPSVGSFGMQERERLYPRRTRRR